MRKIHNYRLQKEHILDMLQAKRHHQCLEITYRDRSGEYTHKLGAGYDDDLDVYREGPETLVLSRNTRLGYIGLEIFEGPDKTGEIFFQGHQIKETLGREDLAPSKAVQLLREYVI